MPGIAELRLPELYRDGDQPAPTPGSTANLEPYQVREMESAVRAAMRQGRVSMDHGKEELRLLGLCREALGESSGGSVPVAIHAEPWPVRSTRREKGEKARQKKARRKNRKPKKRRKR
jgi:hypothetical protein